jgi:hypothetical protein
MGVVVSAHAQISPGPIARAHQSLNGDTNCVKCHAVSTRSPEFRCLECHKEIAAEVQQNKGLHATFPRSATPGAACVKCHSDHNGVEFQMIHWDPTPKGFDHSKTGYALDGKHVGVGCRSCHSAQHISPQARSLLSTKDLNRTWLGLTPSCATCHEDKHQGRFGANCAQCHSTVDWKAASIDRQNFDHSKTRYPLTGAHRTVLCQSCHTAGADGQPRYAGLPFASCSNCHKDPHKGEFKQGCDSCHNTSSWKKSGFATTFDHSKTKFPLLGKHIDVPCVTCHTGGDLDANTPRGVRRLPQARSTWRSISEARRWRTMRELPYGAGMEPVYIFRCGSREDRLSFDLPACGGQVRYLPYSGGQSHTVQDQVRTLRRLPQG